MSAAPTSSSHPAPAAPPAPPKWHENEYIQLRTEMLKTRDYQLQVIGVCLTVTVGLIGYGLTSHTAAVLLIPILPLTFAVSYYVNALVAVQRIATYIRCFLEDEHPDLRYETLSAELRAQVRASGGPTRLAWVAGHVELLFIITGLTCLGLGAITGDRSIRLVAAGLSVVWAVVSIEVYRRVSQLLSGRTEKELLEHWQRVKGGGAGR
jgi:hypothetical protein